MFDIHMTGFEKRHLKGIDDDKISQSTNRLDNLHKLLECVLYRTVDVVSVSTSRICTNAIEALSVAKATTCVSE
jgi:hypothetical protein